MTKMYIMRYVFNIARLYMGKKIERIFEEALPSPVRILWKDQPDASHPDALALWPRPIAKAAILPTVCRGPHVYHQRLHDRHPCHAGEPNPGGGTPRFRVPNRGRNYEKIVTVLSLIFYNAHGSATRTNSILSLIFGNDDYYWDLFSICFLFFNHNVIVAGYLQCISGVTSTSVSPRWCSRWSMRSERSRASPESCTTWPPSHLAPQSGNKKKN